ncbi:larval cuticle protein A2B-like [Diachasma alloeum]|uniref:larval cuticle protein A2B-like n=1 Tax=Diachasma alloeum TaxID=454923 RepID=UPI0007381F97|nr:larval cuticle protein A2B-like [Diachasma alloeum]
MRDASVLHSVWCSVSIPNKSCTQTIMTLKFVILCATLAIVNAGDLLTGHYYHAPQPLAAAAPLAYAAPIAKVVSPVAYAAPAVAKVATPVITKHIDEEYDPNPQYSYAYDVQDSITGDNKQQHESRHGDVVEGSYSFIEADGSRRIVDYTADPHNGFNAVVHKEPAIAKAAPIVAHAPVAYAAPALAKPLAYAAPAPYAHLIH